MLEWRAIVHAGGDVNRPGSRVTEWHIVRCQQPTLVEAHCVEGRRLIESEGQPDGHCLIDGSCLRCDAERRRGRSRRKP